MRRSGSLCAGLLALLLAMPAAAGVYRVTIDADYSDSVVWEGPPFLARFTIDTSLAPNSWEDLPSFRSFEYVVPARVNGVGTTGSMTFYDYGDGYAGEFRFVSSRAAIDSDGFAGGGCEGGMWSGPVTRPTLHVGSYLCFEFVDSIAEPEDYLARHWLRIAEVPEPGSWALLIAGFGLVGGALRRQRDRLRPG